MYVGVKEGKKGGDTWEEGGRVQVVSMKVETLRGSEGFKGSVLHLQYKS